MPSQASVRTCGVSNDHRVSAASPDTDSAASGIAEVNDLGNLRRDERFGVSRQSIGAAEHRKPAQSAGLKLITTERGPAYYPDEPGSLHNAGQHEKQAAFAAR